VIAICAGTKWHRVDESLVVIKDVRHDRDDAIDLTPAVVKIPQKDGYVVVRVGIGIARACEP
jgi:hypothetical protein